MSNAATGSHKDDEIVVTEGTSNLSNIFTTIFGIAFMGVTTSFLLLCVFAFYHTVEGTPWPESGWAHLLNFGLIVSVVSTIIIIIIASVRQIKDHIDKGFTAWIEETAKLAIEQHALGFILLRNMLDDPF